MVYIYGLFDDQTNQLVYVGKTRNPTQRLLAHANSLAKDFRDHCRMEILESGESLTDQDEYFWINCMRYIGCDLINKRYGRYWSKAFLKREPKRVPYSPPALPLQPVEQQTLYTMEFNRVLFVGLRVTQKLSRGKMAKRLGMDMRTIKSWETGASVPMVSHISKVASVLGIKGRDLILCIPKEATP